MAAQHALSLSLRYAHRTTASAISAIALSVPQYHVPQTQSSQRSLAHARPPMRRAPLPTFRPPSTLHPTELPLASLRDSHIPYPRLFLVDPMTNTLSARQTLSAILASLDLEVQTLALVSHDPPIAKILDRASEEAKQKASEEKASYEKSHALKDWGTDVHWTSHDSDAKRKVGDCAAKLSDGRRVTVSFKSKGSEAKDNTAKERRRELVWMFDEGLGEVGRKFASDNVVREGKAVECFWEPGEDLKKAYVAKVDEKMAGKSEKREVAKAEKAERAERQRLKMDERKREAEAVGKTSWSGKSLST